MTSNKSRGDEAYEEGVRDGQRAGFMDEVVHAQTKGLSLPHDRETTEIYNKGFDYGTSHKTSTAEKLAALASVRRSSESTDSNNILAQLLGALMAIGIAVFVVAWLIANIVIPLAVLTSAVIFTSLAWASKERRVPFAVMALVGTAFMLLDISKGWSSANFVRNVVNTPSWLTAFVYLSAVAAGVSAWFLVDPLRATASKIAPSDPRSARVLQSVAIALVALVAILPPATYRFAPSPFDSASSGGATMGAGSAPSAATVKPVETAGASEGPSRGGPASLEGYIHDFSCGDNCYLFVAEANGKKRQGLCVASICNEWVAVQAMPVSFKGKKVSVTLGTGTQYDSGGNAVGTMDAFTDIQMEPSDTAQAIVGVWTVDSYQLVEIALAGDKYRVRICYGADATEGTEYPAVYQDGVLTAVGNAQDFYKFQLPTFQPMSSGKLLFKHGAGPDELNKTTQLMPKIRYLRPVNRD